MKELLLITDNPEHTEIFSKASGSAPPSPGREERVKYAKIPQPAPSPRQESQRPVLLFNIDDTLVNKISYYHLLLLLASLPFDHFYSHIIFISFAVHTIIQLNKQQLNTAFTWRTLVLQSVFFITVASTIYTAYKPEAYAEWGKQIPILLIPLLFCFTPLDIKKYRSSLLLGFAFVCTATVVYLYFDALRTIRFYKLPYSSIFSAAFTNHNFSEPIDMHATFFSMQLLIALVYLISILFGKHSPYVRAFYCTCCCILLAGLFQLCSKTIFFCLLLVINLAVPYFLLSGYKRWKFILITACISAVLMIGIFRLNTFKERFITELRTDLSKKTNAASADSRLERWDAAIDLIVKSPVVGYGAGSEISLLHQVYFAKKYYVSFINKLNVHNQYLSFLLKSGIIGLLVYITTLTFGFREALAKKDLLFFTFMLLIVMVSIAENFLDVDKGIFFYAFFFSFFMMADNKKRIALA